MPRIEGYPYIAKDPGFRGGVARLADFGVRVSGIAQMHRSGMTAEEIGACYEDMPVEAVLCALRYAGDYPQEIEAEIEEEELAYAAHQTEHPIPAKLKAALERPPILP